MLQARWGGAKMVVHNEIIDLSTLPAWVVDPQRGLATYQISASGAEILSLDALTPGQGVGSALLAALITALRRDGVPSLRVTTTNDNLTALRFYQRRGFTLQALRPGAVNAARAHKPEIPLIGHDNIPIRDEIDLLLTLV